MRVNRILVPMLVALAVAACARDQQAAYLSDPQSGEPVLAEQQHGQASQALPQQFAQNGTSHGLFASPQLAQKAEAASQYTQRTYPPVDQSSTVQRQYAQNVPSGRGLFYLPHADALPAPQPSYVLQYHSPKATGGSYVAAPSAYAAAPAAYPQTYTLDSGDKLRVVVFGQEGISGNYLVDAGGNISLPLVGTVRARGNATEHLARMIGARLKQRYVREPHVTVMIEGDRPFFILDEITMPGQYPFVPNMTAE
jgi:hypothetical protein